VRAERPLLSQAYVRKKNEVTAMIVETVKQFEVIDILVNNAVLSPIRYLGYLDS